jgi:hypothetical protein
MQSTNNNPYQVNLPVAPVVPMALVTKESTQPLLTSLNLAEQNSGVITTSITSMTSFAIRLLISPINSAIDQMFFKKLDFMNALKVVKKIGLYKGALVGSSNAFIGTGSYFGSLETGAHLSSKMTDMPIEEARKNMGIKLIAGVIASSLTTPLEYIRIQMQNDAKGKLINFSARNLMRGNIPMSAVVIGNFVFGLGLGDKFNNTLKPVVKNDTVRELAANIFGVFMCNFMFSPLFNLSRQMKYSNSGLIQGLRNMGYAYDPAKYQAEQCTVNSKLSRLSYGMPVNPTTPEGKEKLTIKPRQYVKLSAKILAKNYKMGWKGFATASPLVLMNSLSLALATQLAKNAFDQDNSKMTSPVIEEIK